jgi:hypothetical protein
MQHVDVITIPKISAIEDDGLEICVQSSSINTEPTDGHGILRGPSIVVFLILVRYSRPSFRRWYYAIFIYWLS